MAERKNEHKSQVNKMSKEQKDIIVSEALPCSMSESEIAANPILAEMITLEHSFTELEHNFINAYLRNGHNATQAMLEITKKGLMSNGSARTHGSVLRNKPTIARYIELYYQNIRKNRELDIERLTEELNKYAYIDNPSKEERQLKLEALKLLQKIYYGDKQNISVDVNANIVYLDKSDEGL